MGIEAPRITAAVRTGDTTQAERAAMLRTPPHILVTTPESLFLLLTAERSRSMLHTVRAVIVDEGHRRTLDLSLELPRSPLEAVMSHEVWEEYYDRLAELVRAHRTTLV